MKPINTGGLSYNLIQLQSGERKWCLYHVAKDLVKIGSKIVAPTIAEIVQLKER